jgi:hypothetical protein
LLTVFEGLEHAVVMPSALAKTSSPIRVGKLLGRIFFTGDMWFLAGAVKS